MLMAPSRQSAGFTLSLRRLQVREALSKMLCILLGQVHHSLTGGACGNLAASMPTAVLKLASLLAAA